MRTTRFRTLTGVRGALISAASVASTMVRASRFASAAREFVPSQVG